MQLPVVVKRHRHFQVLGKAIYVTANHPFSHDVFEAQKESDEDDKQRRTPTKRPLSMSHFHTGSINYFLLKALVKYIVSEMIAKQILNKRCRHSAERIPYFLSESKFLHCDRQTFHERANTVGQQLFFADATWKLTWSATSLRRGHSDFSNLFCIESQSEERLWKLIAVTFLQMDAIV